jgi:MFS superfamily sulfate permease-like transporter
MQHDKSKDAGFTFKHWQRDLPASIVVFLVALPLCMGVAIASGAPVGSGLITGIVGGIVVGFLAGSPLQVSGPAAGLTVLVAALIQELGIEKLGVCVLGAGALQLVAGYLRLGQWFRAVSPAVIQGMLAGIGVLIFASQFHVMVDDKPRHSGLENLVTIPQAIWKSFPLPALGNAEQRAIETTELRQLGALHLRQVELAEEVHHLVSGVDPAARIESGHRPAPPRAGDPVDAATVAPVDTDSERQVAVKLQALVSKQDSIRQALEQFRGQKGAEQFALARASTQQAATDLAEGRIYAARGSQDAANEALNDLLRARKNHGFAALLGIITILAIVAWKAFAWGRLKLVPAPLVAIVLATLIGAFAVLPVLFVEVPTNLADEIFFPTAAELSSLLTPAIWLAVIQIALIASAETLLCASAVDQLHSGPRTQFDRELKAQGVGNMICGLLCALPMTGVIVRSSANIQAGAKTRLSAISHGVWLLLFVSAFAFLLRYIPQSSLAAILVYTGYKLVDIKAAKALYKRHWTELAIYLVTVITIVSTHLLTGVLVGIGLAIAKLIYVFSKLEIDVHRPRDGSSNWAIELKGSATFLRLPALAHALEQIPTDAQLHVNVQRLDYIDAACLDLLDNWQAQNEPQGARLEIDSQSLEARFWRRRPALEAAPSTNGASHSENGARGTSLATRSRQEPI